MEGESTTRIDLMLYNGPVVAGLLCNAVLLRLIMSHIENKPITRELAVELCVKDYTNFIVLVGGQLELLQPAPRQTPQ